ncbi:MAG: hypothetical protein JWO82_670, partial [Akkermansiaceae bacterium]|nr:hypothetical protein [Akkermansiaceae bacterium]
KKQMDLKAANQWWMNVSASMTQVLADNQIVAGIKLLKGRPNALRWSSAYSFTSILLKILSVGVTLRFVAPAMRAAMQDNPMPAFFVSNAWYVLCGVLAMIYPLLALILLNQPRVKRWFDQPAL